MKGLNNIMCAVDLDRYKMKNIDDLLKEYEITNWDLILIGDGSGNMWDAPVGWSCILIDRNTDKKEKFVGGSSKGTIGMAELMPYVVALNWYNETCRQDSSEHDVYIFTDSKSTADCGNKVSNRKKNCTMWQMIDWFESQGYCIQWIHINRNTCYEHGIADQWASNGREFSKTLDEELEID